MVVRCGTDLTHIHRIEEAVRRQGRRFLDRNLHATEYQACTNRDETLRLSSLAARFAAKEAAPRHWAPDLVPAGITLAGYREIIPSSGGAPEVRLHAAALRPLPCAPGPVGAISLTHDLDLAQAFCVMLCADDSPAWLRQRERKADSRL
jgi:phosphopantetheine--protein transferase-like protein